MRQLFEQLQSDYQALLEAWLGRFRSDARCTKLIIESPLWKKVGDPHLTDQLRLPSRKDLGVVWTDGTLTLVSVDTKDVREFTPISLIWDNCLGVEVHPTIWDGMHLSVTIKKPDWEPLARWYLKWFGDPDSDQTRWATAVHFLSDPHREANDVYNFELDLGSAPAHSCAELLDAIAATGAKSVRIS